MAPCKCIQTAVGKPVPTNPNPPKFVKPETKVDTPPRPNVVSFASVVAGRDKAAKYVKPQSSPSTSISIDCEVMKKCAYPFALVVCFKDFRAISNIRSMCQGEGFNEVEPKYLGGLWVLLDFDSVERRDAFRHHHAFLSWFSAVQPWQNDFVVKERLLWVEVEGIPLLAWSEDTFKVWVN